MPALRGLKQYGTTSAPAKRPFPWRALAIAVLAIVVIVGFAKGVL